jgi:hypothetical protein
VVLIFSPPPSKSPSPLYRTLTAGSALLRIFDPSRYGTQALTFRYYGPINRFDHHRIPSEGERAEDPGRGIYYAGLTLSCCLVEYFGDIGVIELKAQQICLRFALSNQLAI